jgi:hypothetical protein
MRNLVVFLSITLLAMLGACSTDGQMTSGTGSNQIIYSKYYDTGFWLEEGKLGLQVVTDHEPTSGANAALASGKITIYLINLEQKPTEVRSLVISDKQGKVKSLPEEQAVTAKARSRTKAALGQLRIFNYGESLDLIVQYELANGTKQTKEILLKRRTVQEIEKYFGAKGKPPYPWFEAPYFPFNPPFVAAE